MMSVKNHTQKQAAGEQQKLCYHKNGNDYVDKSDDNDAIDDDNYDGDNL
jgi:hypothetical protein